MDSFSWKAFFEFKDSNILSSLFEGIDYPWEALSKIKEFLLLQAKGKVLGEVSKMAHISNEKQIYIAKTAKVDAFVLIEGACYIGEKSVIRQGAYLRDGVIIGEGCVVGHSSEVKSSILLDGSKAPHFNYIGDSILGHKVNMGAGSICANYRFDHKNIKVQGSEKQRLDTSLKKLGAIIGDEAQIGCNTVLNPGTLVGKKVFSFPSICIGGYIPPQSLIKNSTHTSKAFKE